MNHVEFLLEYQQLLFEQSVIHISKFVYTYPNSAHGDSELTCVDLIAPCIVVESQPRIILTLFTHPGYCC